MKSTRLSTMGLAVLAGGALAVSASAQAELTGAPTLVASAPLSSKAGFGNLPTGNGPIYSNIHSTFSGTWVHGGAAQQSGNGITRLIADDFTPAIGGDVCRIWFTVGNVGPSPVTARTRLRIYADSGNAPGAIMLAMTFNTLTFGGGTGSVYQLNLPPGTLLLSPTQYWAALTFDNNNGTTGATLTDLNSLGQLFMHAPGPGTSQDVMFGTHVAGSYNLNNPLGQPISFNGSPPANLGWQFDAVPEPGVLTALALGLVGVLARRRRLRQRGD